MPNAFLLISMRKLPLILILLLSFCGIVFPQFHQGNCSVYINSRPAGANILIDNIPTDRQTPAMITGLSAGPHLILLEWGEYTAEKKISLEEGIFTRHELTLKLRPVKISIESTPDSASVILGSREIGFTPITAEQDNPGSFRFYLSKPGFMPLDTLIYYPDRKSYDLKISLAPAGILSVVSDPPSTDVFMDRHFLGRTPLEISVPAGEHGVNIMLGDYQDFRQVVTVPSGGKVEVNAVLEKLQGRLTIAGLPSGASIYLDGKFLGLTPIVNYPLLVGEHNVKFTLTGFADKGETYPVTVVQDLESVLTLKAQVKSSAAAVWRSLVLPGWGQYYSERKNRAYIYIAGEVVLVTALTAASTLYNHSVENYNSARSDYLLQIEEPEITLARQNMLAKYDHVENYRSLTTNLAYAAAGLWLCSALDAYFLHPQLSRAASLSTGWNVQQQSPEFIVSWRF